MRKHEPDTIKPYRTWKGETFFRYAYCNRVVQDQNDRPVYHLNSGTTMPTAGGKNADA